MGLYEYLRRVFIGETKNPKPYDSRLENMTSTKTTSEPLAEMTETDDSDRDQGGCYFHGPSCNPGPGRSHCDNR